MFIIFQVTIFLFLLNIITLAYTNTPSETFIKVSKYSHN